MKKFFIVLFVALFASVMAFAENPVPVSVSTEAETGNLISSDDFSLGLTTNAEIEVLKTGAYVGADLYSGLVKDFVLADSADVYEGYRITLVDQLDLDLFNTNTFYIDSEEDTDGYLTLDATWKFINAGFEFYYLPEVATDLYFGPTYSKDFGFGTLDLSATVYYMISPTAELGDIEGDVEFSVPIGIASVYAGVKPTFNENDDGDRAFGMSALLGVGISF